MNIDNNIRNSGINIIGDIPWGTHIAQLYTSKTEYLSILSPYIHQGLINNELCIWIYSHNISYKEIIDFLGSTIQDIQYYTKSGQLIIIPYTKWYIKGNSFNEVRVNEQWNKLIRSALDKGFDGVRAVADISWLEKKVFRSFSIYEQNINKIIFKLPFLAICLYDANKMDAFQIAEIVKNHSYIIARHDGCLQLVDNVELIIKQRQLEQSEQKYNKLIEILPVPILIHDNKKIYYCNQSAVQTFGWSKQELLQKSMFELLSSDMKYNFLRFTKNTLEESTNINYLDTKFICSNGETKQVKMTSTVYHFNGHYVLLSVIIDLTPFEKINQLTKNIQQNRKLLNQTLEYNNMKTEFF